MPAEKMEDKYKQGDLKEYQHWVLTVSFRQTTLASFIILLKRQGVERVSELHDEELLELRLVMTEMETALLKMKTFKPDRFNYLQLGNSLHQLHFHCIPRYATPRQFGGKEWVDERFGTTPVILSKEQESSVEEVIKIRDALMPYL
jgi:diadenosine tetraphosphate (Ap4A) HIT family hydrolase